jgi:hypothetical protein
MGENKMTDNLTDRTTIIFPGDLNFKQAKDLLGYLARELPVDVHYGFCHGGSFLHDPIEDQLCDTPISLQGEGIINRHVGGDMDSHQFKLRPSGRNVGLIESLRFDTLHSSNIASYHLSVIQFWDNVREKVYEFFENPPKKSS